MILNPPRRISGNTVSIPAANTAIGSRYYDTQATVVYVSTGADWLATAVCTMEQAAGFIGGLLSARPSSATCLGFLYTDEDDIVYEAFPGGWATVTLTNAAAAVADGAVTTSKIAASAVTAAKLADAVADLILGGLTVTVTNTGSPDGIAHVTVQAKDAQGNNLAARVELAVFCSATANGAPTDLGTLNTTLVAGVLLKVDTTDALFRAVTNSSGVLTFTYDTAADGTIHFMAVACAISATGNAAITGN